MTVQFFCFVFFPPVAAFFHRAEMEHLYLPLCVHKLHFFKSELQLETGISYFIDCTFNFSQGVNWQMA